MSKISKKQLNDLLALSTEPEIDLVKDNEKAYKVVVEGKKDKLMKRKSLDPILLNFINDMKEFVVEQKGFNQEQKEFNQKIEKRLDNLESKVDKLEHKVDKIENKMDKLENKVDKVDKRVATLETFHQKDIKKLSKK